MPLAELARYMETTPGQVRKAAELLGISVEYYERRTVYCGECGTYRLMDEDGECPVCRASAQLARLRRASVGLERGLEALRVPFEGNEQPPACPPRPVRGKPRDASACEWERVDDEHDVALQEWELQRIRSAKDRVKMRNMRMRKALAERKRAAD